MAIVGRDIIQIANYDVKTVQWISVGLGNFHIINIEFTVDNFHRKWQHFYILS